MAGARKRTSEDDQVHRGKQRKVTEDAVRANASSLPVEVWKIIVEYLKDRDVLTLKRANRWFKGVVEVVWDHSRNSNYLLSNNIKHGNWSEVNRLLDDGKVQARLLEHSEHRSVWGHNELCVTIRLIELCAHVCEKDIETVAMENNETTASILVVLPIPGSNPTPRCFTGAALHRNMTLLKLFAIYAKTSIRNECKLVAANEFIMRDDVSCLRELDAILPTDEDDRHNLLETLCDLCVRSDASECLTYLLKDR